MHININININGRRSEHECLENSEDTCFMNQFRKLEKEYFCCGKERWKLCWFQPQGLSISLIVLVQSSVNSLEFVRQEIGNFLLACNEQVYKWKIDQAVLINLGLFEWLSF